MLTWIYLGGICRCLAQRSNEIEWRERGRCRKPVPRRLKTSASWERVAPMLFFIIVLHTHIYIYIYIYVCNILTFSDMIWKNNNTHNSNNTGWKQLKNTIIATLQYIHDNKKHAQASTYCLLCKLYSPVLRALEAFGGTVLVSIWPWKVLSKH